VAMAGGVSHSHSDQNGIVVGAYGSPLLVNTGLRPWYGSPYCKEWYWTTKAHNALEIDGEGQPKSVKAKAEFAAFVPGERFDYLAGDATAACGQHVLRYRRHLVFLKPDIIVVLDEVKASRPVSLKFWLHGRAPFTIRPRDRCARLGFRARGAQRICARTRRPEDRADGQISAPTGIRHPGARVASLG